MCTIFTKNFIIFDLMIKINSDEIKNRCDTFAVTAGKNGYVEHIFLHSFAAFQFLTDSGAAQHIDACVKLEMSFFFYFSF